MTDPQMTPLEAADQLEADVLVAPFSVRERLRVLIDHARATSPAPEGGDLAEIAGKLDKLAEHTAGEGYDTDASLLRKWRDQLRAHRCAPAPSVATPPQEGEEPCDCGEPECARLNAILAAPPTEGEATS